MQHLLDVLTKYPLLLVLGTECWDGQSLRLTQYVIHYGFMPLCWEWTELDYIPAPGNSHVVSLTGSMCPNWNSSVSREEIRESPVGPKCGHKKRPVKSGEGLGSWRARSHMPPWAIMLNETLPCIRKTFPDLPSRRKAAQSFFPLPFPHLCTHWHFCVLDFFFFLPPLPWVQVSTL